jgi:signal transduction histidine kinase
VIATVGAAAVIFVLHEVLERSGLVGAQDAGILRVLHLVLGIGGAVAAVVLFGWVVLRTSPPLGAGDAPAEAWPKGGHVADQRRLANYAQWFILVRWIAVLASATLVLIVVKVLAVLPGEVWWPLVATVGALAGTNLVYTLLLGRQGPTRWLLPMQAFGDLAVLTVLLHFSGGIENLLCLLMLVHVTLSSVMLGRRHSYAVAGAASGLLALMAFGEWSGVLEHYTLQIFPHVFHDGATEHAAHQLLYVSCAVTLQTAIFFLIAYFVTNLAERLRHEEQRLKAMADHALAERQLLAQAIETSHAGLRVLDRDMRSYWANDQWKEWFAAPPEALPASAPSGPVVARLVTGPVSGIPWEGPPGGRPADWPAIKTFRDGKVRITEFTVGAEAGGPAPAPGQGPLSFQLTTAPLLDRFGKISQIVELVQDITEQKRAHARMLQAGKLAVAGELAGQVVHEVNNPIAIMIAKAHLLLNDHRGEMSEKVAEELEKIAYLSGRVGRIAQGLLSYCRPSGSARTALDIRVPWQRARALIEERAQGQGVRIGEDGCGSLPLVEAAGGEMEQLFLNLFINALDAMPDGGRLTITAAADGPCLPDGRPCVAVTVADTGPGISDEAIDKVFEPFFSTKQEGKGTGLGLSICQGIVRNHGGEILVQSGPSAGTRFIVRLPVRPCEREKS